MTEDTNISTSLFETPHRNPRCLQGVSIMLVDDSRSVSEAIRLMAIKSGARIRRADCLASAKRHLGIFKPDLIIIDLDLPDGSGIDLSPTVEQMVDHRPAVLILSGADQDTIEEAKLVSGADGYLTKPVANLRVFQEAILDIMPNLKAQPDKNAGYKPDVSESDAYLHDLENMQDLLKEAVEYDSIDDIAFCAQFLTGAASTAGDTELANSAQAITSALAHGAKPVEQAQETIAIISQRIVSAWSKAS